MKLFTVIFLLLTLSALGQADVDLSQPIPVIRLADGRVLRSVTFAKFNSESVLLRSNLGPIAVRYEALPDDIRPAAEKKRPGGPKPSPGDSPTPGNAQLIEGQAFVHTRENSSYKFGNITVYAFDISSLGNLDAPKDQIPHLPKPIQRTMTDAEGKFKLWVPRGRPCFIFAQATRPIAAGSTAETQTYEWRVPVLSFKPGDLILLSAENAVPASRRVEIERAR